MDNILVATYVVVDDFIKSFDKYLTSQLVLGGSQKRRTPEITDAEIMTIIICFHNSRYRDFRNYYSCIRGYYKHYFPKMCSYNRFVELMKRVSLQLLLFFKCSKAQCDGVSFIDSTPIRVCKNKRIYTHKVFNGLAKRGMSSMGWFFGFKLHIVINSKGGIINFFISSGNTDDRKPAVDLCKDITGKVYGGRGYISSNLFKEFMNNGIRFFTALRTNMKPKMVTLEDSVNIGKRSLVESVFNMLKNSCQIEHSRHRSPANAMIHLVSGIISHNLRKLIPMLITAT
jgi:hypothetical protein